MPFQSEKQRRYLWANEPEIARDWTDTYGSGIAKALGGRIGFYRGSPHSSGRGPGPGGQSSASNRGRDPGPGPGGQSGDRGGSLGSGPHGGEWSGPSYSPPKQLTVTRPSQHIGAGDTFQNYNKNLRNLQRQQEYQQGAYQRAHPFLSKIRSGLGSLGRGIGHVARNFNPVSLAFDNPLMKLLTSGYGRGNIRNLGSNQNINWNDPDEAEDIAWENVNYNPYAKTRLQSEEGIMGPNINKDEWDIVVGEENPYKDFVTQAGYIPKEFKPSGQYSDSLAKGLHKKATTEGVGAKEFRNWLTNQGSILKETHPEYANTLLNELMLSDKVEALGDDYVRGLDIKGMGDSYDDQRKAVGTLLEDVKTKKEALKGTDKSWMLDPNADKRSAVREFTSDYSKNKDRLNDLGITTQEEYEDFINKSIGIAHGGRITKALGGRSRDI